MKKLLSLKIIVFIAVVSIFYSCKKENDTRVQSPVVLNHPPVANAGQDQAITIPANSVNLDGSSSSDPDNNIIAYKWKKNSGPDSYNIANDTSVKTQLSNLVEGVYQFELKVTDAGGLSAIDNVQITVIGNNGYSSTDCGYYWVCLNVPTAVSTMYGSNGDFYQAYGASAATKDKVYFAGGSDDFSPYGGSYTDGIEYDPAKNSIRNFSLSVARSFLAGASAGNKILFAGGEETSNYTNHPVYNTVDIYDEQTLTQTTATLSEARSHLAVVSLGTKAFFIGGKTQNGFSDKMDIYKSDDNSWQVITLPQQRGYAGAAIIGSKIYIAGGKNNSGNLRTIDIYDIETGLWSSMEAPNEHQIASVAAVNNKLIVAGGDGKNNKAADIYNTSTMQWTTIQLSDSRFYMTVAAADNKVVFLGGAFNFSGVYFSIESGAIDVYDDNTGQWYAGLVSPNVSGTLAASVGTQIIYTGFMWDNGTTTSNTIVIVKL